MFDFFKRKKALQIDQITLPFKSAEAAFEYCCVYMDCSVRPEVGLPALVLDATKEFGTKTSVSIKSDGVQLVALKVPSKDGGFLVMAETFSANGPALKPGKLVVWRAVFYSDEIGVGIAAVGGDPRSGWVGAIMATLQPIWSSGTWVLDQKFR